MAIAVKGRGSIGLAVLARLVPVRTKGWLLQAGKLPAQTVVRYAMKGDWQMADVAWQYLKRNPAVLLALPAVESARQAATADSTEASRVLQALSDILGNKQAPGKLVAEALNMIIKKQGQVLLIPERRIDAALAEIRAREIAALQANSDIGPGAIFAIGEASSTLRQGLGEPSAAVYGPGFDVRELEQARMILDRHVKTEQLKILSLLGQMNTDFIAALNR